MWKDIDLELNKQIDGDIRAMTGVDAVINSLSNISRTLQGSRRMLPDFALPFYHLLFEPVDEITGAAIGNYLINTIQSYDSRIELTNVSVEADRDAGQYNVKLAFKLKTSTSEPHKFEFILMQQG